MRSPMPLELRDPSSGSTFQIPDEGLTIGREGGKADFQVKDNGVSKSHCRIYLDGDAWFLEDLGSANGTYLGEDKLAAPTELMPNDVISMSKTRFEVLGPVGDENAENSAPPSPPPAPKPKAAAAKAAAVSSPPKKATGKLAPTGPAVSAARKSSGTAEAGMGEAGSAEGDAEAKGIGYFLVAVPKAIAFYLTAIPLMALNPLGTIRKGVEDQKHEAKAKMELIAFAIPPLLFAGLIGWICTVIVQLRYGTLNIMSILPIVPILSALIGAAISGFIWHPVVGWVVTKAKGESDERSRTNYFLMFMTGLCVIAIPNALGTLLTMVPFRLILILPPVLGLAGTLVSLFISYSWLNYFGVVKWLPKVVLGLGVISAVFTVLAILSALTTAPGGGTTGGDADAQIAAAMAASEKLVAEAKEGGEQAKEAAAEAKVAGEEKAKEAKGAKPAKEAAVEKPMKEELVAAPPPPVEEKMKPPEKTTVTAVTGGGYAAFAQMRESVEKRINDDPTLLKRTSGLLEMYRAYETDVFEIEAKYLKETAKKPSLAKFNNHLRDAEMYEKTEKQVKELHGKLK